ncbi:XdhC family protein [bacterium BMS3Abin03]|nr:XdhC family protein [bacterium BMS3Abin03]
MKELELWTFVNSKLEKNIPVMLLAVADSFKSSPGRAGFKLALAKNESLIGTIGGGIMEHDMLVLAGENFKDDEEKTFLKILHHNPKSPKDKSGLICGGTQAIIFSKILPEHKSKIEKQLQNTIERKKSLMILSSSGLDFDNSRWNGNRYSFFYKSDEDWRYEENSGEPDTVYIIGGGHVGLAVSRVMATLDFYVITFDKRKDVFTMKNNTYAHKKMITEYEKTGDYVEEGDNSYVVVVTSEFSTDKAAIKSVINKKVKYLGLMGSASKIHKIFSELENEGVDTKLLEKIHTPIGLEIKAESPEEIGISIAAEIINIKHHR